MTDFYWPKEVRTKHLYIPGMSGYGKTSLMANLVLDDIEFGDGAVIVIDPKGTKQGLINRVIKHIPQSLIPKIKYLSLRHPIPLDLLGYKERPDNFEKNLVKGDIIRILQRFSMGNWGTNMQEAVNDLVPTLLEAEDTTFLDIANFFQSEDRRRQILKQVSKDRQQFWKENPPSKSEAGPVLARMSNFKEPPLSTIVGGKRGEGLNIADVIEQNQILFVDTSPNTVEGWMLGALVMSRIQQAIFRRSEDEEHPLCHVYADEFHNFVTPSFGRLLLEARSFNFSICMANPTPMDLKEIWHQFKAAVSSYVIFKMDSEDAMLFKGKLQDNQLDSSQYERELRKRNERIAWLKDAVATRQKIADDAWNKHGADGATMQFWNANIQAARSELQQITDNPLEKPEPPRSFLEEIPRLQIGEAVYIAHDGATTKIKTRQPPEPSAHNYAKQIMEATYVEYMKKRILDKPAGNDTKGVLELKHDDPGDGNAESPTLLPKRPKKKRS